jgi:hypothetical protein
LVRTDRFDEALAIVSNARSVYRDNIFIISLEKQVSKLRIVSKSENFLDPGTRVELLESLPHLIARAIASLDDAPGGEPLPTSPAESGSLDDGETKKMATAVLKYQSFRKVENYVKSRDYTSALMELKRIQLLDPDDQTIEQYINDINELVKQTSNGLEARGSPQKATRPLQTSEPIKRKHTTHQGGIVAPNHTGHSLKVFFTALAILAVIGATVVILLSFKEPKSQRELAEQVLPYPDKSQASDGADAPREQSVESGNQRGLPEQLPTSIEDKQTQQSQESNKNTAAVVKTNPEMNSEAEKQPVTPASKDVPSLKEQRPAAVKGAVREPIEVTSSEAAPTLSEANTRVPEARSELPPEVLSTETRLPSVVKLEQPRISNDAWRGENEGEVTARVQISAQGVPLKVIIVKTTNESLNDPVVQALMKSQYTPGIMPTGPVTTWLIVPVKVRRQ